MPFSIHVDSYIAKFFGKIIFNAFEFIVVEVLITMERVLLALTMGLDCETERIQLQFINMGKNMYNDSISCMDVGIGLRCLGILMKR